MQALNPTKPPGSNLPKSNDSANNKGRRTLTDPNSGVTGNKTVVNANKSSQKEGKPASKHHVHKKPTLEDTIEHVFAVLRDQSELENGIPVPPKFFYFYDSEMLRHFLACVVYYFYAFTQVKDLERDLSNAPDNEHIKMQLEESKKALKERLRIFAEAYCRLILHCSNFERTQEDQSFFEFLFEFTRTTCRMAVAEEQWDSIDEALGHIFRGYMFNTESLRSPRSESDQKGRANDKMKTMLSGKGGNVNSNSGVKNSAENDDGDFLSNQDIEEEGSIRNKNRGADEYGNTRLSQSDEVKAILKKYARQTSDEFFKVANRLQTNTAEAKKAIDLAKNIIASHKHKVTRVPRAKRVREKHNKIMKMTKLSHLNEKRLGISENLPGERPRNFSIRKTFNTRSPMISLLLPTPAERLEIAMMHYENNKKTSIARVNRQRQRGNSITQSQVHKQMKKKSNALRLPAPSRAKQGGILSGI